MTIGKGAAKTVAYKKETTFGTLAGAASAKYLRRVTSAMSLKKEQYESAEIRVDRQTADARHGVRSAEGSLNGELSPSSYSDFMQAILARDFTTGAVTATMSVTIAASGSFWTVTRATGSFLTDNFNVGKVIALTGGALNVLNVSKNLLIVSMTATVLTVKVLNNTALLAEGPIASVIATVRGKDTFVPLTGHTDQSFTIEEFYSDIAQSEVYVGMKTTSMNTQLPATGLATVDFSFMGADLGQVGTSQYFTSPTAQGTNGIFASVQGAVLVNGLAAALITSADFNVERATENAVVVGSNAVQDIFTGRIKATGNLSVYFQDAVFRDYFKDETEVSLVFALATSDAANADFVSYTIPRVKLGSFDKTDGELGLTASTSFTALLNSVTTGGLPATTLAVQDSTL
jgi:riboflavin synthase alpha subunit